jgi:hypothetical protein
VYVLVFRSGHSGLLPAEQLFVWGAGRTSSLRSPEDRFDELLDEAESWLWFQENEQEQLTHRNATSAPPMRTRIAGAQHQQQSQNIAAAAQSHGRSDLHQDTVDDEVAGLEADLNELHASYRDTRTGGGSDSHATALTSSTIGTDRTPPRVENDVHVPEAVDAARPPNQEATRVSEESAVQSPNPTQTCPRADVTVISLVPGSAQDSRETDTSESDLDSSDSDTDTDCLDNTSQIVILN